MAARLAAKGSVAGAGIVLVLSGFAGRSLEDAIVG
jgi:hypothetical protein